MHVHAYIHSNIGLYASRRCGGKYFVAYVLGLYINVLIKFLGLKVVFIGSALMAAFS